MCHPHSFIKPNSSQIQLSIVCRPAKSSILNNSGRADSTRVVFFINQAIKFEACNAPIIGFSGRVDFNFFNEAYWFDASVVQLPGIMEFLARKCHSSEKLIYFSFLFYLVFRTLVWLAFCFFKDIAVTLKHNMNLTNVTHTKICAFHLMENSFS